MTTKRKAGRPPGRTYPVRLQLTLTRQAAKELREISKAQQLTVNEFVRRSIEGGVLKHLRAKSAMEMSRLLDAAEAHLSTASENQKREIPVSEHDTCHCGDYGPLDPDGYCENCNEAYGVKS